MSGADAPGTDQRERRTMSTPGTELETVNLQKIELKRFPTGRAAREAKEEDRPLLKTSVRLTVALYDAVKTVADRRSTSVSASRCGPKTPP